MSSLLDLIIGSVMAIGLNWYQSTLMSGLNQLPETVVSFFLSYLVIQLFFFIFPPLKKLAMILGAPFRYMHVWLHLDTAKRIETKKYASIDKKNLSIGFWGESKGNDVTPLIRPYYTTYEALKIASAPLLGSVALLFFLVMSSPIFARMGVFGLVLHIYFLFSCFGVAFPSLKDYSFLVKGNTVQPGSLHPGYVLWAYFIFAVSGYITLQRTSSALAGFRDGCFFALVYICLLVVVSKIGKKSKVVG